MAPKRKPKRMGRPPVKIDWDEFDKLCLIQCTLSEIADWFKCSESTIVRKCKTDKHLTFEGYYKKHSSGGRISLRRSQFKAATKGNPALLIWLGKQYLGQKDQQGDGDEVSKPTPVSVVIQVEDASS